MFRTEYTAEILVSFIYNPKNIKKYPFQGQMFLIFQSLQHHIHCAATWITIVFSAQGCKPFSRNDFNWMKNSSTLLQLHWMTY